MERSVGSLNESWGKTLVEALISSGVDYFCIAPGFRTTPLTLAVSQNPKAQSFIHYDERGLAFHALGVAKASGKPVAIIVTSGTAVGNLMPAVMEAYHSHVPLILLTADRPHELRDTKANQTADQLKIFGDYVQHFVDLPVPTCDMPDNYLSKTIAKSVSRALYPIKGPVQINCPYREPFFDEETANALLSHATSYMKPELSLRADDASGLAKRLESVEKGVIIAGAMDAVEFEPLTKLAKKLRWPILPDIISSYRSLGRNDLSIPYYHHILKTLPDLEVDLILHFGDQFVSKSLLQWMGKHEGKPIINVSEHHERSDPCHVVTDKVICPPDTFCKAIEPLVSQKTDGWLKQWQEYSHRVESALKSIGDGVTEPAITKMVEQLASETHAIFFANSMPIRDADMFFFPKDASSQVFANRGLSGIDGNIATIAGIAQVMPVIAVIGDQTLLHDLNSLAMLKKTKYPVKLIVINNGGGGIFSFVKTKKEILDEFFAAKHDLTFEHAASLFNLPYVKADLLSALKQEGTSLIEVQTNREENLKLHQTLDREIASCLSSCTVS